MPLCTISSNFNSEDIAWLSSLQTLLNFQAKYFSVICLPYIFHSLFIKPFNFELRGMKEFTAMDQWMKGGDERIQQWTNG